MKAENRKPKCVITVADVAAIGGTALLFVGVGVQFSWAWSLIVVGVILVSAAVVKGLRSRVMEDVDHDR